ncbi:MAG: hypothetical protein AB1585_03375 [Thermodesulfobacteriota bacterium]
MKKNYPLWIGLFGLAVFQTALFFRVEAVTTYFYSFIWWSYIVMIDGLIYHIRGNSLLINQTRRFFLLIPWSTAIWLVFEGFNLVLKNWYYIGLPKETILRWPGYFLAFGTVLPAILETKDLLSALGIFEKSRLTPMAVKKTWYRPMIIGGALCLLLALLFPVICFPLVWLGFIFLLEPFNHQTGRLSLLKDLERGKPGTLYQLLVAGMICGLLWEFWNFWATAKWVYTVPWVGDLKLFEMPILGFLGFPPFALECYVLVHFLRLMEELPKKKDWLQWQILVFCLLFYWLMFTAIDLNTVRSYG